ncbi:hypothetical protein [Shinella zoogloeoides]|uniref:hypothetical protein n=1 Tax=Shinella zoogloeoides TaxID=352475 RepID=UPI0028ACBFD6|nr:hypothetical protein [Shinella zoogloeoides]
MSAGHVIGLLIACGCAALVGFAGTWRYSGAHLWAGFTAMGLFAALLQRIEISWISVLAPLAFAYGAAYIRAAKERGDI